MRFKWTPFNGLIDDPFWKGFCNGWYKACLLGIPIASLIVAFWSPIISIIWIVALIMTVAFIQWYE